jgi:hypothetical protein
VILEKKKNGNKIYTGKPRKIKEFSLPWKMGFMVFALFLPSAAHANIIMKNFEEEMNWSSLPLYSSLL